MISFRQFLLREKKETVEDENGIDVEVWINPTLELMKKLATSIGKMRYFFHDGNIYTWDANDDMIHHQMADALSLDFEPNWFDSAGYWGQGQNNWIDVEQDIMPTIYKAANAPKGYDDFWQVGAWQSSVRSAKFETTFRTRAAHDGPRVYRDYPSIKSPPEDSLEKMRRIDLAKVRVKAHTRSGYPVLTYSRSYPD